MVREGAPTYGIFYLNSGITRTYHLLDGKDGPATFDWTVSYARKLNLLYMKREKKQFDREFKQMAVIVC